MMLAAFILVLLTAIASAQPLADSTKDDVATKIINLAVTTKRVKVKGKSKIRKGSLAGLIVGIVIAVIILAIIAFLLYKRQRKKKALGGVSHEPKLVGGSSTVHESTGGVPVQQRNDGVAHV